MKHVLFVHGVPDTPHLWRPLISTLALKPEEYSAPALPGFGCPCPEGFAATKEGYADWLIRETETAVERAGGPIHIVGHDWGALFTLRACSLKPDLIANRAVSNAVIDSQYSGHRLARIWNIPVLGELAVLGFRDPARNASALIEAGMPEEMARHEGTQIDKTMRQCILKLIRSSRGLRIKGAWEDELANLSKRGMLVWGETDPYFSPEVPQRFSDRWKYPLHTVRGAGHWAVAECPGEVAAQLDQLWRYT